MDRGEGTEEVQGPRSVGSEGWDRPQKEVSGDQGPTHYLRYFENIPKGLDREGWTRGGIQPQKAGGYALNESITRMDTTPNPTETLRQLHPHVGR